MLGRPRLHPSAATMRHLGECLLQNQAFFGTRRKNPSTSSLFHQRAVIGGRIEAENRQLETILPRGLAMAAAAVAAQSGKQGHDVVSKVDRWITIESGHTYRQLKRAAGNGDCETSLTVGNPDGTMAVNPRHVAVCHVETGHATQVDQATVSHLARDEQILLAVRTAQLDPLRLDGDRPDRR
jgi:hypothetical protein